MFFFCAHTNCQSCLELQMSNFGSQCRLCLLRVGFCSPCREVADTVVPLWPFEQLFISVCCRLLPHHWCVCRFAALSQNGKVDFARRVGEVGPCLIWMPWIPCCSKIWCCSQRHRVVFGFGFVTRICVSHEVVLHIICRMIAKLINVLPNFHCSGFEKVGVSAYWRKLSLSLTFCFHTKFTRATCRQSGIPCCGSCEKKIVRVEHFVVREVGGLGPGLGVRGWGSLWAYGPGSQCCGRHRKFSGDVQPLGLWPRSGPNGQIWPPFGTVAQGQMGFRVQGLGFGVSGV